MELSEIRTRIDAVDDQLLKLFLERMELAEEVAAYKNEHHLPILNKQREREILAKVTARAGDKEPPKKKDRNTEEVEAESISYAVCQYYGIQTGENSFGYIAN